MKNSIYVAKLGRTVGLKGHLKLFIESDFPEQFKKGVSFTTNKNETLTISECNVEKNIIRFENFEDINLAKRLTNTLLFTSYEQTKELCNLLENEHFWFDLVGCEIVEDGLVLGSVKEIYRYPISDYFEIETSSILVEQKDLPKTFLLPHLKDYILNVNIEEKRIEVKDAFAILENS